MPRFSWPRQLMVLGLALLTVWGAIAAPARSLPPRLLQEHAAYLRSHPLKPIPGFSPRQTLLNFLAATDEAESLIHAAIRDGMAEPGLQFSAPVRERIARASTLLNRATETLDLSQEPKALRADIAVGIVLRLKPLLNYELAQQPQNMPPGIEEVRRQGLRRWTLPETNITLAQPALNQSAKDLQCQECTPDSFLFSPRTVAAVAPDFERIFRANPALRRQFGNNFYIYWAYNPGGLVPPKLYLLLPETVRRVLDTPLLGQSYIQWLLLLSVTLGIGGMAVWLVLGAKAYLARTSARRRPLRYWWLTARLLPVPLLAWAWGDISITWINLTGVNELAVVVVQTLFVYTSGAAIAYLLFESLGQQLALRRSRTAAGTLVWTRRKGAGQMLTILRLGGVMAAATVMVAGGQALGLTSVTLLAVSSVPALAISLGTQQLIRDIAEGFSLLLDGQVRVGDKVSIGTPKSGQIDGVVESIGMRSVTLRLKNGSLLSLPNSQIASSVITNHSQRTRNRFELRLKLSEQRAAQLEESLTQARATVSTCEGVLNSEVHLDQREGDWFLVVGGEWSDDLSSSEIARRRDSLFLRLNTLES